MTNDELQTEALKHLFERYQQIIRDNKQAFEGQKEKLSAEHLNKLCQEAIDQTTRYPFDKLHRWLGFIQGVLTVLDLIDVDTERNYTRPYLHSYHQEKPPTF